MDGVLGGSWMDGVLGGSWMDGVLGDSWMDGVLGGSWMNGILVHTLAYNECTGRVMCAVYRNSQSVPTSEEAE